MKIESYACGAWIAGSDDGVLVRNAINGETIGQVSSTGLDFAGTLRYGVFRQARAALRAPAKAAFTVDSSAKPTVPMT